MPTPAVIGQHLDHPALVDAPLAAALDHRLQLRLERGQAADALLDVAQAGLGDRIRGGARLARVVLKGQQGPDRLGLEAQLARMAGEGEAAELVRPVLAAVAFAARRCRQQPDLLVEPDGWHFYPASAGHLADQDTVRHSACSSSR
jgi:hypothetical protein